jgi:hypothetical protein
MKAQEVTGGFMIKDDDGKILVSVNKTSDGYLYMLNPGKGVKDVVQEEGTFIQVRVLE